MNKTILSALCMAALGSCSTPPAHAQLDYKASWIGNTFGKNDSDKWVQNNIAAMYVSGDGTCYTNSNWDEGHHEGGIYKNGDYVGAIADLHENHWYGGFAVAGDGKFIYVANGDEIRRHNLNGSRNNWRDGDDKEVWNWNVGGNVQGLAFDKANNLLFSSDNGDEAKVNGEMRVYDLKTMTLVRNWSVPAPGRIAVASDGSVWVAHRKSSTAPGQVTHYSATGTLLPQTIAGGAANPGFDPTAVVFDGKGRLLVGDNGPDQQVKIYGALNQAPKMTATLGAKGGIFSGTVGSVAPLKFNGITGLGVDDAGNIYVSQNRFGPEVNSSAGAGTILESYTPAGKRNWQLLGLEFVDGADATPGTDGTEVYTKYSRYKLDFSKKALGSEWTYQGHTLNPFKYPDDPRMGHKMDNWGFLTSYQVRLIAGKKFQFNASMWGNEFVVYRFNAATDGETAIPAVQFGDMKGGTPNWMWRDLNGNGAHDDGENTTDPGTGGGPISSYTVDDKGDLWQAFYNGPKGPGGVRCLKSQGVDAHGVPKWSFDNAQTWPQPAPFTEIYRTEYDSGSDTLYLSGYAEGIDPKHHRGGEYFNEKAIGSVVARYDNWSKGNRAARWVQILSDYNYEAPSSLAFAGDYVFVGYDGGAYSEDSGHIRVRRASDGVDVGQMWAGPYNTGRLDVKFGLRALKRTGGEYIVFLEDDWYARVMMYRWTPPVVAPKAPALTVAPGNSHIRLKWTKMPGASVYDLKRSTTPKGPYTTIAHTDATSFTDIGTGSAGVVNGTTYYYAVQAFGPRGDSPISAQKSVAPSSKMALRINAGGGTQGDWLGDLYNDGKYTDSTGSKVDVSAPNAAPMAVYQSSRGGAFTYVIPGQTVGAKYLVRLHFSEFNSGLVAWRKQNVSINGVMVLKDFNIGGAAGGKQDTAVVKDFSGITPNEKGEIVLQFSDAARFGALLNGLEIIPQP